MELQDYICFYMKCPVALKSEGCSVDRPLSILGYDEKVLHVVDKGINLPFHVNIEDVILLLRPLSELSEDENSIVDEGYGVDEIAKKEDMHIVVSKYINSLRDQGFDTDGLIPAGLAIALPARIPAKNVLP